MNNLKKYFERIQIALKSIEGSYDKLLEAEENIKMRKDLANHPIEKVGKELRAMMPWIGKNKLVDKDKN